MRSGLIAGLCHFVAFFVPHVIVYVASVCPDAAGLPWPTSVCIATAPDTTSARIRGKDGIRRLYSAIVSGYGTSMTTKEIAIHAIEELPEDATWEDVQERINFVAGVREGLRELDEGHGVPHDRVREEFAIGSGPTRASSRSRASGTQHEESLKCKWVHGWHSCRIRDGRHRRGMAQHSIAARRAPAKSALRGQIRADRSEGGEHTS